MLAYKACILNDLLYYYFMQYIAYILLSENVLFQNYG